MNMVKYKYQRLTKEEKKEEKLKFYATERGKDLKNRFFRILVYSIMLILFGIVLLAEAITKNDSIAQYIYSVILIIFGIGFIIGRYIIMIRQVNDFIVKKPKKK